MLNGWLDATQRPAGTFANFEVVDVVERSTPPEKEVVDHLRDLVRDALVGVDFITRAAERLGWGDVASLVSQVTPQYVSFRRGDFGEALTYGLLEQLHGYTVPARKLRLKLIGDQSLAGTDALALRATDSGPITEVAFVESKLRTVRDDDAVLEAYRQLREDADDNFAAIVLFTAKEMDRTNHPLSMRFLDYLRDRAQRAEINSYRIVTVWDQATWNERVLVRLQDEEPTLQPLRLTATRIGSLAALVDEVMSSLDIPVAPDE